MIAELDKLSQAYPFRAFELETTDGRRIRVTKPYSVQSLYGSEEGDIRLKNGTIAYLRYSELKDIIYLVPFWQHPFGWLSRRPELLVVAEIALLIGIVIGIQVAGCSERERHERCPPPAVEKNH